MDCAAVLTLLLAFSVASGQAHSRPRSFEVFDAVLDSLYHSQGDKPDVVIVADSLYWREGGIAYGGKFFTPHRSVIRLSTLDSFETVTSRSVPFPRDYRYTRAFHVLSVEEYGQLVNRSDAIQKNTPPAQLRELPYWIAFTERFPKAWGLTALSRVGFNEDSTEALIHVRHQCGGGCYSSEVILLDRLKTGWKIVERMNVGSNEGIGSGALRYLGPGAHFIADMKRREDSTRRAIADSIRRDRAPRRLRGKITSVQTGLPIPYAQLFVHTIRFPAESIGRIVADSHGRYVVRNPLMGATMLEVQCPGKGRRNGATLSAPGTYVFPAMDTTIDIQVHNIEPCWQSRRVLAFNSGELASSDYRESPYPSPADLAVYASVVRELQIGDSAVVTAETRPWCRIFHQCPTVQVAHLERIGLLDSSTFRNFEAVASDSVRLRPIAMDAIGMRLLSVGERTYLMQESRRGASFSDAEEERNFWTGLRTNYKGANRILSFTRPGYSDAKDQAIVSYHIQLPEDEIGETILLKKTGEQWRVLRRHLEAETISAELVEGECAPKAPAARPSDEELANISGLFDFTLIASATDNRVTTRRVSIKAGSVRFDKLSGAGEIEFSGSLLIRGVSKDHLFGEWSEHFGGHGIPIGRDGKAIPYPAGYFCAKKIEQ